MITQNMETTAIDFDLCRSTPGGQLQSHYPQVAGGHLVSRFHRPLQGFDGSVFEKVAAGILRSKSLCRTQNGRWRMAMIFFLFALAGLIIKNEGYFFPLTIISDIIAVIDSTFNIIISSI